MMQTWLYVAAALAFVPLGSRGSLRLATLSGGAHARPIVRPALPVDVGEIGRPVAIALGGIVAVRAGPALGISAGLVVATCTWLRAKVLKRRERLRRRTAAILVVQLVHAELESGAEPATAVQAGAGGGEFVDALTEMAGALRHARDPTEVAAAELRPLAHALHVCARSGAPASAVLEMVRDQLQAGLDRGTAVTGALAGVRSSAVLLAVLPALGIALGAGLGVNPIRVLLGTTAGHGLVLIGVALECVGLWWTARMAASAEGLPP